MYYIIHILYELQHVHFSCSSTLIKTKDSDFNIRFYYVYSLALNLFIFVKIYFIFYQLPGWQYSCYKTIHYYTSKAQWHMPMNGPWRRKKSTSKTLTLSMSKIQIYLKPRQGALVKPGLGMIWHKHKSELSYLLFSL